MSSRRWISLSSMDSVARYAIGDVFAWNGDKTPRDVVVIARNFAERRIRVADHTRGRWLWYTARSAVLWARLRARCALAEFWERL